MSKIKKSNLDKHIELSNYKIEDAKKHKIDLETGQGKKVIGYCRVSTDIQAKEGDSLDAQKENIERYCKNKGLILVNVLKECISGALQPEKRPLFSHIMRELNQGNIDGIVIFKLDRLSRSINDTIRLMSLFSEKKWLFYEIKNNLSTEGALGMFTIHLFSALNQLERSIIQERVNEVNDYRLRNNLQRGMVPFGKDLQIVDGVKLLVDNPEEQETLRMLKEYREEEVIGKNKKKRPHSFQECALYLTQEGRRNKFGSINWYATNCRRHYYGHYLSGKGNTKQNKEEEKEEEEEEEKEEE